MCRLSPAQVSAHFSRVLLKGRDLTESGYPDIWRESCEALPLAIEQLATARPACIGYAVTAGSFMGGRRWEEDFRRDISRSFSIPATSAAYGIVTALEESGVRRVAVVTAYVDYLNKGLRAFIESYGFSVVALEGVGSTRVQGPAKESSERISDLVRKVNRSDAQGIVISCTGLSVLDLIEPLERELGKPVLTSNQAIFWSALRLGGNQTRVQGFGALLRDH